MIFFSFGELKSHAVLPDAQLPIPYTPSWAKLNVKTPDALRHLPQTSRSTGVRRSSSSSEDDGPVNFNTSNEVVDSSDVLLQDKPRVGPNSIDCRTSIANGGISISLDCGLDTLGAGVDRTRASQEKEAASNHPIYPDPGRLTGIISGSDPNLTLGAQEESKTVEEPPGEVTELLQSWHEGQTSHYPEGGETAGASGSGSLATGSGQNSIEGPSENTKDTPDPSPAEEAIECTEESFMNKESSSDKIPEGDTDIKDKKSEEQVINGPTDNIFSRRGDLILDDVALRTAALARNTTSFKMSFSRQNTQDEYH